MKRIDTGIRLFVFVLLFAQSYLIHLITVDNHRMLNALHQLMDANEGLSQADHRLKEADAQLKHLCQEEWH